MFDNHFYVLENGFRMLANLLLVRYFVQYQPEHWEINIHLEWSANIITIQHTGNCFIIIYKL